jgi:hypothetical protein
VVTLPVLCSRPHLILPKEQEIEISRPSQRLLFFATFLHVYGTRTWPEAAETFQAARHGLAWADLHRLIALAWLAPS